MFLYHHISDIPNKIYAVKSKQLSFSVNNAQPMRGGVTTHPNIRHRLIS